jgi:hypothetical protein
MVVGRGWGTTKDDGTMVGVTDDVTSSADETMTTEIVGATEREGRIGQGEATGASSQAAAGAAVAAGIKTAAETATETVSPVAMRLLLKGQQQHATSGCRAANEACCARPRQRTLNTASYDGWQSTEWCACGQA